MVDENKRFEGLMSRRFVPEARSNLEQRIIDAARPRAKAAKAQGSGWLEGVFVLPRPALAFALVLVFGAALGVYAQDAASADEEESMVLYIEDSMYIEEML